MATTRTPERLTVIFPKGHSGTSHAARRLASTHTSVPQTRIRVVRLDPADVDKYTTVAHLRPWTPDYEDLPGWTPYLTVRGIDIAEGAIEPPEGATP